METPDGGSSMTTAFSTPSRAVVIRQTDEHRVEARDADTGHLLGAAAHPSGQDVDFLGWHVECGGHREWAATAAAAAETLARLASDTDDA
jgi:hypothetical protein